MTWALIRRKWRRAAPQKIPEIDAIFPRLHTVNHVADTLEGDLRLSLDAKATIRLGPYARGGYHRRPTVAVDHDFTPAAKLSLFGGTLPAHDDTWFFLCKGPLTADFIGDRVEELWPELPARFRPHTLVLNRDNGPEHQSHRTQFIKRLVDVAHAYGVHVELAYSPPYQSKDNPIERVWGILEQNRTGELIETKARVVALAQDMTWKGKPPVVRVIDRLYHTGIRLTKSVMDWSEAQIQRLPGFLRMW